MPSVAVVLAVLMGMLVFTPEARAGNPCPVGVINTIVGTSGDDIIVGTPGRDAIVAGEGDDRVYGRGGKDWICGGPGRDRLFGGTGSDNLYGRRGRDRLLGGQDGDHISAGAADDLLYGGRGRDVLIGGSGDDVSYGGLGGDSFFLGPGGDRDIGGGSGRFPDDLSFFSWTPTLAPTVPVVIDNRAGTVTGWGIDRISAITSFTGSWNAPVTFIGGDVDEAVVINAPAVWALGGPGDDDIFAGGPGTDTCTNGEDLLACE
jgi:hemolysin type calcium-binding protein